MANLKDLEKYLNYEFSSGCFTGEDYKTFERKYTNLLKTICKNNNWSLIKFNKNHYCFSAFIKGGTENKYVYISISDVRYFNNDWFNHILIRTAKNEVDYKGGFNYYTTLDKLEGKICELLEELPF
ncbi:MAG: hypothetical protein ACI4PF_01005 [Christensenellales bacterium]